MRTRTSFSTNRNLLAKLRGSSAQERLLHRLHSVTLVVDGLSASEAARIYGDSPRAVAYWVTRYKKLGITGLQEELRPGRPSRLNSAQMKKLQSFTQQLRRRSQPVNGTTVAKYIKSTFGVTLTIRQCWRLIRKLNT